MKLNFTCIVIVCFIIKEPVVNYMNICATLTMPHDLH